MAWRAWSSEKMKTILGRDGFDWDTDVLISEVDVGSIELADDLKVMLYDPCTSFDSARMLTKSSNQIEQNDRKLFKIMGVSFPIWFMRLPEPSGNPIVHRTDCFLAEVEHRAALERELTISGCRPMQTWCHFWPERLKCRSRKSRLQL
jgi:hypothetical protein